jgi:4-aminobutyrate aminotransferase-like enzyme
VLRLTPPLVVEEADVDRAVTIIGEVLSRSAT